MSDPVVEQIADQIETVLAAITEVAAGGGVYRPATVAGYGRTPPGNYCIQMTQGDPARITDLDVFPSLICWDQPFSLDLIYRPSDAATDPVEAVLNAFLANVWAALMADPQWTNQAIDTVIGPPAW